MNKHTQIRHAVLAKLESLSGSSAMLHDGLPVFIEPEELPALAVWLTDAQFAGQMLDESDWEAVLHVAVFLKAQAPDAELDLWMEEKIFPALEEVIDLENLINTMTPLGYDYQRDSEMATWGMAEITYPNGTVDVFRGWLSSLGKTVTSKEVMTRSVKITGVGRPSLAEEDTPDVVSVSGVTVAPASATVAAGATTTLTFTVKPDNASDKTLQVATADPLIATVTLKDNVATVKGVKAGSVNIVGISSDGSLVAVAAVTVTAS